MLFPTPANMQTRPGSTFPSIKCLMAFVALFLVQTPFTSGLQDSQFSDLSPFQTGNNTAYTNGTLAPYFHNVSGTYTWILPRGKYDIGAGSMMCECFDPADGCCMPVSHSIAPFCVAGNATCCGDTYCSTGESCCGGACCPSSTTCTIVDSIPGCCPANTTCAGPPSCLDATSSACLNENPPPANCCPQSLSICGPFSGGGQACYATMPPSSTTTSTEPATTIVTFQGTLEVLSEKSASTDYTYYLPPSGDGASIFTLSNVVEVFTTVWAIDVLTSPFSIPTATHLPTTTITVKGTFTVPRAQSPPPGYSLWRPELSEPVSTFSDVVAVYTTIWAIDVESSPEIDLSSAHAASSNATSTHTLASTSSKPYTGGGICDPSPCEPEPTNGTIATTTSKSALCFNAVLQRNMPCSTTSTVSKFDYTPAGASTVGYNGGSGAKEAARAGTLLAMIASLMQILRDLEGLGPAVGFLGL